MTIESKFHVGIERNAPTKLYPFERFFRAFGEVAAVRALFGKQTPKVLRKLKVEFFSARFGYMGTSDVDGHLIISNHYLKDGEFRHVYLDVVHELCHVNQFHHHKPLFYPKLSYVDAPSEIEAYKFCVKEGKRIGMTDKELIDYLKVEWISPAEHRRLARHVGLVVKRPSRKSHRSRLRK
ncbi:MAG: hypothetical protein WCB19_04070 [Thermoplasmata archaeon]